MRITRWHGLGLFLLLAGCQGLRANGTQESLDSADVTLTDTGSSTDSEWPDVFVHEQWIGSPCISDDACDYDGGFCLTEDLGYPAGHCSLDCDLYCPDEPDTPVTFCIEPTTDTGGHCFSRCDYDLYNYTDGCRPGYACVPWLRHSTTTEELTCVPESWTAEEPCSNPLNFEQDDDCQRRRACCKGLLEEDHLALWGEGRSR